MLDPFPGTNVCDLSQVLGCSQRIIGLSTITRFLYNKRCLSLKGRGEKLVSARPSLPEVSSSIPRCDLKSFFWLIYLKYLYMRTLMERQGGKMSHNVNFRFAISSTVTRSYRRKIRTCTLGKYAWMGWTNVSLALLTLKNVLEHTSFISHGRTRQSNPFNLKTPLCRTTYF